MVALQLSSAAEPVRRGVQAPALHRHKLGGVADGALHHLKRQEAQSGPVWYLAAQGRGGCALPPVEAIQLPADLGADRRSQGVWHVAHQAEQMHGISTAACPRCRELALAVLQRYGAPVELGGHREAASSGRTKTGQPIAQVLFVEAQQLAAPAGNKQLRCSGVELLQLSHQRIELGIAEERLAAAVGGISRAYGLAKGPIWARFGRAFGGQSVKSQSGRQDSNLRPSAPKANSAGQLWRAFLDI